MNIVSHKGYRGYGMTNTANLLLIPNQVDDDDLILHFNALDVGTISAYKLWCYRHDLSTDLDKTPQQRLSERTLFERLHAPADPQAGRDHDPRRAAIMARILRGEMQDEPLTDVLSRVRKIYNALEDDEESRRALGRLALQVEKYSNLFRPSIAIRRYGQVVSNTYIAALEQLARHHRDWVRSVEEWRPEGRKQRDQFSGLARHLLAKYDVPPCMDSVWFQGNAPEARQEQEWFKHVGFGQNIRTAGVPMRITKRMAHIFVQNRSTHNTLVQALRVAQVMSLGDRVPLTWDICNTMLGDSFDNEEFWVTVVHFFVNNYPMLDGSYFEPIIDYIRYHKYVPRRITRPDGTVVEGSPPNPNFAMKGRSAEKLVRLVDEWHNQLTGDENIPLKKWASCGLREYSCDEADEETGRNITWTVHELRTSPQLGAEGRAMNHCVFTFADRCLSGETSIWSIRVQDMDDEESEQENILTVAVDNKKKTVTQARGRYNLEPFSGIRAKKKRRAGQSYLRLLRESARILRLWMDREGLAHG